MIQNNLENETEIRRFLLGELSENDRNAIEAKFFADEDFFVQIRASEDELIESYIRGTLETSEKEKFERNFLTTKTHRQRIAFTREMLGKLNELNATAAVKKTETVVAKTSVLNSIIEFFKTPKFAFGAGFAILIVLFGGWFLLKTSNETDIVKQITPTPTVKVETNQAENVQTVSPNQNVSVNSNVQTPKPEIANNSKPTTETPKKEAEKPKEIAVNPVLALFAGTVRSNGKTSELNLPKNASGANLVLNLEAQDYQTYRAEIVDADGNVIYRSGKLRARNSKINTFVPAKNLKRGDYMLKLYGFNPSGAEESAADFQFRVNQK